MSLCSTQCKDFANVRPKRNKKSGDRGRPTRLSRVSPAKHEGILASQLLLYKQRETSSWLPCRALRVITLQAERNSCPTSYYSTSREKLLLYELFQPETWQNHINYRPSDFSKGALTIYKTLDRVTPDFSLTKCF